MSEIKLKYFGVATRITTISNAFHTNVKLLYLVLCVHCTVYIIQYTCNMHCIHVISAS